MGWFADKYGKDTHPKMSIDTYDDLLTKFGEKYANEFLEDVQDGIYSEKQIRDTYLDKKKKNINPIMNWLISVEVENYQRMIKLQ